MPRITLKLFASLQQYLPVGTRGRQAQVDVAVGETAGSVLERLGVPRDLAHLLLVNGQHRDWDTPVTEGDTLSVFPPVAGGRAG
jgi:molybdopterin converting factor small subunit